MMLALALPGSSFAQATRFTGTWEGIFHGGRGDQPVALVCLPRGVDRIAGAIYFNHEVTGRFEDGRVRGDSISFPILSYRFLAARIDERLEFSLVIPHGRTHTFSLARTGSDTTIPPRSVTEAVRPPRPRAVAWDTVPDSVYAAHAVANDQPSSALPCLRKGTLLLIGGGPSQPDLSAAFLALSGGANARIVVIPTASVETTDSAVVRGLGSGWDRVLGTHGVTVMHTSSRREADSETFVAPLRRATGVWLSGGEAGHILSSYLGTRTERELIAVLDRGGVVGGTSAGALVWGSECQTFRAGRGGSPPGRPEDLLVGDPHAACFGVLRNVLIAPHFTEFGMQSALDRTVAGRPGLLAFGVDESTALEVHGDVCTVLGRGNVTVYDGREHAGKPFLRLHDGARYDLRRRQLL